MNGFVRMRHYYRDCVPLGMYATFEDATAADDIEPSEFVLDECGVDPAGKEYMDVVTEYRDGQPYRIWSRESEGYARPDFGRDNDEQSDEPSECAVVPEVLLRSWQAMSEAANPSCEYCHGTGWSEFDGVCGRCECLPDELQNSFTIEAKK